MKTSNLLSFVLTKILAIKQKIGRYTNEFYKLVKVYKEHQSDTAYFSARNTMYEEAESKQIVRWLMVLFVVIPILILVDYASLKLFVDYLQAAVGNQAGSGFLRTFGIFVFFILELATAFAVLKINEEMETRASFLYKVLKFILMIVMIGLPAMLIFTGYMLQSHHPVGSGIKVFTLMVLSLVIHTVFFVLIDDFLRSIGYLIYQIQKMVLYFKDPESRLEQLKTELRSLYGSYDLEHTRFSELPDSSKYTSKVELSRKELFLRERLEDDIDDNDYDEFTHPKHSFPVTTSSSVSTTSTTVW
ncbi:MAG: hypothetical protein WCO44_03440 [Bacteroidota bacterium]